MAVAVSVFPLYLTLLFLSLRSVSGFIGEGDTYRRRVSFDLNPGLNASFSPPPGVGLLHVRAQGQNDTLHFLFSSQGAPVLLLVHTDSLFSSVKVDWQKFLSLNTSGSVNVEPKSSVLHSSALVFTRLWEYDDANNTADPANLPPSSFFPPYELQHFTWEDLNRTINHTTHTAQLCGGDGTAGFLNGSFCLGLSAFESVGRDPDWPRLLHNANCSQVRFWLKGVTGRSNHSRFFLELQRVGSGDLTSQVETLRSIDDEYSPSIFKVSQWVSSPANATHPILGYVQWKPVAYRTEKPAFSDAMPCRHSSPQPVAQLPASDVVMAYFSEGYSTSALNMTFGIEGDPLYNVTNYLSWTVLVGVGSPPIESFSPLVIAIMAVGLGTPLFLILVGGVYVCFRKLGQESPGYAQIN